MSQLLEKQRTARMTGSLDCSDPDSTCLDSKSCIHQVTTTSNKLGTWFVKLKIFFRLLKPRLRRRQCLAAGGGAEAGGGAA